MIRNFLADESGISATEYGLMFTLIAIFVITAVSLLGTALNAKFNSVARSLMYRADPTTGNPIPPASLPYGTSYPNTIQDVINNELTGVLPAGSWTVKPSGPGYTSGTAGQTLTVQVQFTKNWSLLGDLLHTPNTITVSTTMVLE